MIASARAVGLAVGVYDFDQDYTIAEARVLVARARAAGILPTSTNTFPLYFDVEYGHFSYAGLLAQIALVRSEGYRVGIYTGAWYWGPHAGCRWPTGVSAWLSGYPSAPVPCGLSRTLYVQHQFTDTPTDLTAFLGSLAAFHTYVNVAAPKPNPFLIYPLKTISLYGEKVSERRTVERWWTRGCQNPVKRAVCVTTRRHLEWFAGRLVRLASTGRSLGEFNLSPDWSSKQARRFKWPQRHYRIERILNGSGR